jgi:putative ABC transport system permease protein
VNFATKKDLGFNVHQTLVVHTPDVVNEIEEYLNSLDTYKKQIEQNANVISASTADDSPGAEVNWIGSTRKIGADPSESLSFYRAIIDEDFIPTMGLKIIAGENFRKGNSRNNVLLNKSGSNALGFEIPEASIGQRLILGGDTCTVVGVIEDYHQVSPLKAIAPTVFHYNLETPRTFFIRFEGTQTQAVVSEAQKLYHQLFPNEPFDYYFLDDFYDRQYDPHRKLASIIASFCTLAILVSSLGLLGLTWFRVSRQKKELAIRNLLGSSQGGLFFKASKRIIKTTALGCLIGIPLTWYVMSQWLQNFSYHTSPKAWHFGVALLASLAIALGTVTGYLIKIIRSSPASHLRAD